MSIVEDPETAASAPTFSGLKRPSSDNNFNILRVILAVSVIFSHSYPLLFGYQVFDPVEHVLREQRDLANDHPIDLGHAAVYGFFVISGYLVTMSWQHSHGFVNYLAKRALRICPGFAFAVLFCLFVTGPITADNISAYWSHLNASRANLLVSALGLRYMSLSYVNSLEHVTLTYPGSVNGSMWTISYEFECYMIVAILGTLAGMIRRPVPSAIRRAAPLVVFIAVYSLYAVHCGNHLMGWLGLSSVPDLGRHGGPHWRHMIYALSVRICDFVMMSKMLTYFLAGMCLYLYRDTIPYNRPLLLISLIVLAFSIWCIPILAYTLPVFGSYVLLYIAFVPSRWHAFGRKTDLSYGLYLYAFPIQMVLVYYFKPHLNAVGLFLLALPLTALLALGSWILVERPCLKLKSFALRLPYC